MTRLKEYTKEEIVNGGELVCVTFLTMASFRVTAEGELPEYAPHGYHIIPMEYEYKKKTVQALYGEYMKFSKRLSYLSGFGVLENGGNVFCPKKDVPEIVSLYVEHTRAKLHQVIDVATKNMKILDAMELGIEESKGV